MKQQIQKLFLAVGVFSTCLAFGGVDFNVVPPSDFQSAICGEINQIRVFTSKEQEILQKGQCFTLKLVPSGALATQIVWSNFFHANSSNSCQGLTRFGATRASTMVYLFGKLPYSEKSLMGFNQVGTTTSHEFHHYWTNSKDDGGVNDPKNIYDDPAMDGLLAAVSNKIVDGPLCEIDGETQVIKTQAQELACACKIKFWSSTPIDYK